MHTFAIDIPDNFNNLISIKTHALLLEAAALFRKLIEDMEKSDGAALDNQLHIEVAVSDDDVQLNLSTDESYTLTVETKSMTTTAYIFASTFFGARHGLETLSQLILWDDSINHMIVVDTVNIADSPAFAHRGIVLDTSRSYIELPLLRRMLDAMAYSKLNVFHWHITDTQSFPFVSNREPLLAMYGAYSADQTYRPQDIRQLVDYATVRGIKIVPEFDAPAHVGSGWEWGERYGLGPLALCINKQPWSDYCAEPPCGQLNPINDNIYQVLGNSIQ